MNWALFFLPMLHFFIDTTVAINYKLQSFFCGAVAQLGERMAGSHEVRGSIPLSSTI